MPPEQLATLKREIWAIEKQFSVAGKRCVNLDPGFLDMNKVVLASFKPGPQKLYLGNGVWADTVLFYENGAFTPLPWTFPDLRAGAYAPFFTEARSQYKKRLRNRSR